MTQKSTKIILEEIYSKAPKKNHATNKTDFYQIDDIWSFYMLHLKDCGPENTEGRDIFVSN